jgi:hypothetical protein
MTTLTRGRELVLEAASLLTAGGSLTKVWGWATLAGGRVEPQQGFLDVFCPFLQPGANRAPRDVAGLPVRATIFTFF